MRRCRCSSRLIIDRLISRLLIGRLIIQLIIDRQIIDRQAGSGRPLRSSRRVYRSFIIGVTKQVVGPEALPAAIEFRICLMIGRHGYSKLLIDGAESYEQVRSTHTHQTQLEANMATDHCDDGDDDGDDECEG